MGDQVLSLTDLKAGETEDALVPWSGNLASTAGLARLPYAAGEDPNHSAFSLHQTNATADETHASIREALEYTLRTYGGMYGGAYNSQGYDSDPQNRNAMACGFIGWFDAKTLDVRVDGKAPEGEQENMLYVHLPLPGNAAVNSGTDAALLRLIPNAAGDAANAETTQEVRDDDE